MWFWFISGVMWVSGGLALLGGGYALISYIKSKRQYAKSFEFARDFLPSKDEYIGELQRFKKLLEEEKIKCLRVRYSEIRSSSKNKSKHSTQESENQSPTSAPKEEKPTGQESKRQGLISGALDFVQKQRSMLGDDGAQVMISFNDPTRFTFLLPSGSYSGGIPTGFVLPRTTWRSVRYASNECVIAITNPDDRNFCGVGVYDVKKEKFVWATNYRVEAGGCVTDAIPTDASMRRFRLIYTRANGMGSSTLIP